MPSQRLKMLQGQEDVKSGTLAGGWRQAEFLALPVDLRAVISPVGLSMFAGTALPHPPLVLMPSSISLHTS